MINMFQLISYANRVGVHLTNFKQKKARLWEFSHSCETAHRFKKLKARAYIYETADGKSLNVKCQHCGYSKSLPSFIKEISPSLYDEFRLEAYREHTPSETVQPKISENIVVADANLDGLIPVNTLPKSSPVLGFLARRCIPEKHYNLLYVAKHFYPWASFYKPEFKRLEDTSPRLVLPYFDIHGRVLGFTARTFSPKVEPRYIHLRLDKDKDFIYGTERINPNKTIYVTEGQIDSLFIDNAVAVGGAHYDTPFMDSIKTNCVIIPDNDWKRNSQVGKQLKKVIARGFKICFMPDSVKGKDLNQMVQEGISTTQLKQIIDDNVKQGLSAQLEFALLKKY